MLSRCLSNVSDSICKLAEFRRFAGAHQDNQKITSLWFQEILRDSLRSNSDVLESFPRTGCRSGGRGRGRRRRRRRRGLGCIILKLLLERKLSPKICEKMRKTVKVESGAVQKRLNLADLEYFLENEYFITKLGYDPAENAPSKA